MTQETINQILKFRDDRDWKQFHNPKDLAISISLGSNKFPSPTVVSDFIKFAFN